MVRLHLLDRAVDPLQEDALPVWLIDEGKAIPPRAQTGVALNKRMLVQPEKRGDGRDIRVAETHETRPATTISATLTLIPHGGCGRVSVSGRTPGMRLLVTGGGGFVGSNFVRFVLEHYQPEFVTTVDVHAPGGNPENLRDLPANCRDRHEFFAADITDREDLRNILRRHRYFAFVNFAAGAEVSSLLEMAREAGVKRFIQPLAVEEAGQPPVTPDLAGCLQAAHADYGQETIILHSPSNYGPYQAPHHPVPSRILSTLRNTPLPVETEPAREWIHVDDHCRAIVSAMLEGTPGASYVADGGFALTSEDISAIVTPFLAGIPDAPVPAFRPSRLAVNNPLRESLGWKPIHDPASGLRETAQWYRAHPQWWTPLLPS